MSVSLYYSNSAFPIHCKVLSVKVTAPEKFATEVVLFCKKQFLFKGSKYEPRNKIVERAILEAYKKCGEFDVRT